MSLNRKLRDIAEILPPLPQFMPNGQPYRRVVGKTNILGADILKEDPEAKISGKDVDPKKNYIVTKRELVYENHAKRLIDIKAKFGIEGLRQYVSLCYKFNKLEEPQGIWDDAKSEAYAR